MKRSSVYLEDDLHKALKIKAVDTEIPMSSLVNEAVRKSLIEDAEDLQAFNDRAEESSVDFESFVQKLKRMGNYRLRIKKSATKEIEKLTQTDRIRIIQAIEKLALNPRPVGSQKLSGQEKFRFRVGNYWYYMKSSMMD